MLTEAEKQDRDSLAQLQMALANAPFGFVLVDLECRYLAVNAAMTTPTKRDPSLYIGKTVREMVPQIADLVESVVRRVSTTGMPELNYELNVGHYSQLLNSYPVRTSDGKLTGVCSFVLDITDKKALQLDVDTGRRRLADFIEQLPGLVWEGRKTSDQGPFETVLLNAFPVWALGYSSDEMLQEPDFWKKIVHPDDREAFLLARGPSVTLALDKRTEYRCIAKDGRVVHLECNAAPILDAGGKIVGMRSVAIDVTERKESEIEKARLMSELRRSLELRNEFIAIASHELRTPLTVLAIQASAISLLLEESDGRESVPGKIRKLTGDFSKQIDTLSRMVNDLLEVRHSESGNIVMKIEEVDLKAIVESSISSLEQGMKSVGFTLDIEDATSYVLQGDRIRLGQVLLNLLTNALKYGASRPIHIALRKREQKIELEVKDHGIGIAPEDHSKIFECYERVGEKRNSMGLGLGLYIVREIVRAHSGNIQLESKLGDGSCFRVILPTQGSSQE